MARPEKRTPENNWLLSEEKIEELRHHYVEERVTVPRAAYRTGISEAVAAAILRHKGWMRSPWGPSQASLDPPGPGGGREARRAPIPEAHLGV